MNLEIFLIVALYLIGCLLVGFWGRGLTGNLSGFFVGERGTTYFPLVMTVVATGLSAWALMGLGGQGYRNGIGTLLVPVTNTFVVLTMFVLSWKANLLGRKHGYITPSDVLVDRYGGSTLRYFGAIAMIVTALPYLAIQFIGPGLLMQSASQNQISYETWVIILAVVGGAYCIYGGWRAIVYTDIFQAIVMALVLLTIAILPFGLLGGLSNAFTEILAKAPERMSLPGMGDYWSAAATFSLLVSLAFGLALQPQMWSRYFAGRDRKTVSFSILIGWSVGGGILLMPIIIAAQPMAMLIPGLQGAAADSIVPMFVMRYTPPLLAGLIIAAVLAAAMSTAESIVLSLGSIVIRDLFHLSDDVGSRQRAVLVSRWALVAWTLIAIVIGILRPAFIFQLLMIAYGFVAQLAPAFFGGLYWRRGTRQAAIASTIVGEVILLVMTFVLGFGGDPAWLNFTPLVWSLAASAIVYVGVSLLTPEPASDVIEKFFGPREIRPGMAYPDAGISPQLEA